MAAPSDTQARLELAKRPPGARPRGDGVSELGEAMISRGLASGGEVSVVGRHGGLDDREGVGTLLRHVA